MFEKEIQAITERTMTQLGEPGIELTLDQIEESGIHPAVLRYITAEMEFMIFRERKKLLRDAFFDYSDPEVEPLFEKIADIIIRKKKLNHEDMKRLVYQAASMNINYLLRPRWTINRFVFNKVEARSIEEVRLLLNYTYFYKYIRRVILSVFDIKKKKTVEHHEFRDLLNNLDRELLETQKNYILKDALESMSSFFTLAGDEEGTLRTGAVILFLKEKGMNTAVADIRKQLSDDPEAAFPVTDYEALLIAADAETTVTGETPGEATELTDQQEPPFMPPADHGEVTEALPGAQALDDLTEQPAEAQQYEETMPDQQAGYEEMTDSFEDEEVTAFEPAEEEPAPEPLEEMDENDEFTAAGEPGEADEAFTGDAGEDEAEPAAGDFADAEELTDEMSEEEFELVEVDEDQEDTTPRPATGESDEQLPSEDGETETPGEAEPPAAEEQVQDLAGPEIPEEEDTPAADEIFEQAVSEPVDEPAGDDTTPDNEIMQDAEVTPAAEEEPVDDEPGLGAPPEEQQKELDTDSVEDAETELIEDTADEDFKSFVEKDEDEEPGPDSPAEDTGEDELTAEQAPVEGAAVDESLPDEPDEQTDGEPEAEKETAAAAEGDDEPEVEIASPEEAKEELDKVVGDSEVPPSSPGEGTPANPQTIKRTGLPDIEEEDSFVNPDDIDSEVARIASETDDSIKESTFAGWGPEDRSRDDVFSYFTPQESQKLINELFNEDHVDFVNTLENIGECANHLVALKRITLILQAAEIKPASRSARLLIERIVSYFAEKGN